MNASVNDKILTVEEYIQHELKAERRSEYINGQLFEMPGEKDINNIIAGILYLLCMKQLQPKGYFVFNHDIKIGIPNEQKYFYPDVFATKEQRTEFNQYIKHSPELIIEVVSASSHSNDYIDKFIAYTKIPSLQYYLIVEPETILVTLYKRTSDGWEVEKFTKLTEVIALPVLDIKLPMSEIYNG
jgi:Uma2 family endonuclease